MVERIAVRAQHPRPPLGTSKPVSILLFGELLVDRFPDREVPGGAPFNVAHHLQGLAGTQGPTPILISRIGKDPLGKRLLAACEAAGLATTGIQRDALHPSGRVEVVFDAIGGPHRFVIPPDQAWDYIHADTARKLALMYRTRRLYFGTLAQRAASRRALQRLLRHSRISGFLDVNLRDPWIDVDVLRWSLTHAATVKLNEEELDYLGTLFELGAALLGVVFLVKAAAWPLNFWLPGAYAAAAPPVAGVFAILTKVGVYALLRFATLLEDAGAPAPFGGDWLFYCGLATIAAGTVGVLAAQKLARVAGFLVIVSSGTLLAAFGFTGTALTGPALYYLVSSVLASGAFFMVIEMAERGRTASADLLAVSFEAFGLGDRDAAEHPDEMAGVAIPAAMAFLGLAFFSCALLLTGLPPLSGFVGKFTLFAAAIAAPPQAPLLHAGLFGAALLLSGLAGVIALSRLGMRVFWDAERPAPRLQWIEAGPVAMLVLLCMALALGAGPAMRYFDATARALHDGQAYVGAVLPAPGAAP